MGAAEIKGCVMNHIECQRHIETVSNCLGKLTEANHALAEIESLDGLLPHLMDLAKEVAAAEGCSHQ